MDNFDFRGISAIIDEGGLRQEDIFRLIRLQNEMNAFNPLMMSGNGIMQINQRQYQNYNSNNIQSHNNQIIHPDFDLNKREQPRKISKQQGSNINVHTSNQQPFSQRRISNNNNFNYINFHNSQQTQHQNQPGNHQYHNENHNHHTTQGNHSNQQTNQGNQSNQPITNLNKHRKRDR